MTLKVIGICVGASKGSTLIQLETWEDPPRETSGVPHPGQFYTACTCHEEFMYFYGGRNLEREHTNEISCLNLETLKWSKLSAMCGGIQGSGEKIGLRMVYFSDKKLVMVGGYGPRTSADDHSFIEDDENRNHGWSGEIYIFEIGKGKLSSDVFIVL